MDPVTSVGAGLAVIGSKDLLTKILGPTADYVGGEIKGLIQKCNINLDNIFVKAKRKLGARSDEEGVVNPRVLKHILDEGRFCEDELTSEYLGGVLAASKSIDQNDDRGVSFLKQLESMSSYQIRFHYISYYSIHKAFVGSTLNPGEGSDCAKMRIFLPFAALIEAMGVKDKADAWGILTHAVLGLYKLGLIADYKYGDSNHLKYFYQNVKTPGFIVTPNLSGAELFLWGLGIQGSTGHELLTVQSDFDIDSVKINAIYEIIGG